MRRSRYLAVTMKCPRRVCCQQSSLLCVQNGVSLPLLITSIRLEGTPRPVRYSRTALARRSPSARLYSAVPRSSQCPSMVMRVDDHRLSQSAFFWRTFRPSSRSSDRSRSKKTSPSGISLFRSSSDFRAKTSSSVSAFAAGGGAGGGGGGCGGGGGVGGAVATGGGAGGGGAGGGTVLAQLDSPITSAMHAAV